MSEAKKIEERHHSLTVPGDMYHLQPGVITGKRVSGIEPFLKEQQDMVKVRELVKSSLNLEDASGEAIKPLSTPNVEKNEERGKGRS
ncbi:MAG: hypothetical protein O7175_04015 [Wolbachia endosymbiont of Lasioglossum nitidulum]|nr:hypothetical protein [Wolbachia endosymbiont of Lasioglossum nitidulum]MDX5510233.1 hypothetical protein [Wolbachia endosymbiont of Lasioglossum morio]MDX5562022.1 hypothetical protein [Wolbachia endosymbiont of Andrena bicolor]